MIIDGVFDLGEHFSMRDGCNSCQIVCMSMKMYKGKILKQGRVLKSDSNIAPTSRTLILETLEMFCKVCKELERLDLISLLYFTSWIRGFRTKESRNNKE